MRHTIQSRPGPVPLPANSPAQPVAASRHWIPAGKATATHQHGLAHAAGGCQAGVQHPLRHVAARQDLIHCQPPLQRYQLLISFCRLQVQ